jgi:hypothetical protein
MARGVERIRSALVVHPARARAARVARIGVLVLASVLAGAYAFYVVGMNVFLSTSLFEKAVDADPMTIDVHYRRAWSVWPGLIHARDLSIRSRDSNVEFMLRIDQVRFRVSFVGLARQRFEASHVRGTGVSLRLRQRLDSWDLTPEHLAGLPPIEGLSAVPVRPYRQCALADQSDADYHLWTIDLEDVQAHDTREVWIDQNQLDGAMAIDGRFYLKPIRAVEIGPLEATVHDVRFASAGTPWFEGLDGKAGLTLPRFDPRPAGDGLLRALKVHAGMRGVAPDVGRLPLPLPDGIQAHGAAEVRVIDARFEDGTLRAGTHVEAFAPGLFAERGEDRITGALSVDGDVTQQHERVELHALVGEGRLSRGGQTAVVVPRLTAAADFSRLAMDRPVTGVHVAVDSPDVDMPDLRALALYLPDDGDVKVARGHARADLQAEAWLDEARATGHASMQADDVDAQAGNLRLRGEGELEAKATVASYEWRASRLAVDAEAKLGARLETIESPAEVQQAQQGKGSGFAGDFRVVVQAKSAASDATSLDLTGTAVAMRNVSVAGQPAPESRGDLVLQNGTFLIEPSRVQGVLSATVSDATSLMTGIRESLPGPFQKLTEIPLLLASARLTSSGGRVRFDDIQAHGGVLAARGLFGATGSDRLGAFVVDGGPFSVGVQLDPEGTHLRLFGLDGWLQREEAQVGRRVGKP